MADEDPGIETDRLAGAPHPRETPQLFGQAAAEAQVLDALARGRVHHGWLIVGPRGVGKATLAYRMARALIAGDGGTGRVITGDPARGAVITADATLGVGRGLDAPPGCPVAARIRAQSEPCLAVLRRGVAKTGRPRSQIAVEEVRAIRPFLGLSAADGGWRAVIVDAADEMNANAANAILKALEEPPARTAFLLVAQAPGALLPTIRSRCRGLTLAPLGPADLGAALAQAGAPVAADQAGALAELAQGSVAAALELGDGGLALYARLVATLAGGRIARPEMLALADLAAGRGNEATYALMVRLIVTLTARLARAGVRGPLPEAAPDEARILAAASPDTAAARAWAAAAGRVMAATAQARAVNLDPGQTIIDTMLDLDATLAVVRRAA